jgi:HPt (histidine-containing phosphotransfer) domain-containing protein
MIDWARISELEQEIGLDSFAEVVDLFLSEVEGTLTTLAPNGDRSGLHADLHFLKGAALNLGFTAFSALCQSGETLSAQGQADAVDLGAITACFHASYATFQAELAQRHVA